MSKVPDEVIRERQFLKRKIKALSEEYRIKVTYDFSRFIYVGVKENCKLVLEDAIFFLINCAGYEAHRVVLYKNDIVSNIYVRFADEDCAEAAIDRLFGLENYNADKVSAMLLSWYLEEMLKGNFPWTLALVSIEGRPEHPNPLSQDALQDMLMQFGDPKINSYQNSHRVEHVQVLFSSMSEALGASIAFGRWFVGDTMENSRFHYKIQIMGSEKEATLLKGIQPKKSEAGEKLDAFEMDYFVQKMEMKTSSRENTLWRNPVTQSTSQDFKRSPRVREFRRQFSRGRGNGGRGRAGSPQWQHENRNPRKFPNYSSHSFSYQEFPDLQNKFGMQA